MPSLADAREAIASYFGIPVFQADPWLSRMLVTLNLDQLIELATEKGGVPGPRAAVHSAVVGPIAAQKSRIQLMNPANSGMVVKVKMIRSTIGTAGVVTIGFVNIALATAGVNRYLDQRIGITPDFVVKHPAGSVTVDTNAASGIAAADILDEQSHLVTVNTFSPLEPIILPPGFGLRAVVVNVNVLMRLSIYTVEVPQKTA